MPPRHILVVDDEELVRSVLTRALERHGYRVTQVANGRDAVATLSEAPEAHDLVLLDVNMPGFSGTQVLAELNTRKLDVAVLLMTGHAEPPEDHGGLVRGFIRKPIGVRELVDTVGAALE